MFGMIPIWQKALAAAVFVACVFLAGLITGREQVQDAWDIETKNRDVVVAKQETKVEVGKVGEAKINDGVKDETDSRIAAIHAHYNGVRKQQRSAGAMSVLPGGPGQSEEAPSDTGLTAQGIRPESYTDLAERCAVTTAIALGWQEWYSRQLNLSLIVFGDASPETGRDATIPVEE